MNPEQDRPSLKSVSWHHMMCVDVLRLYVPSLACAAPASDGRPDTSRFRCTRYHEQNVTEPALLLPDSLATTGVQTLAVLLIPTKVQGKVRERESLMQQAAAAEDETDPSNRRLLMLAYPLSALHYRSKAR